MHNTEHINPIMAPSTVFLGLTWGIKGVFPKSIPPKYANESLVQTPTNTNKTIKAPGSKVVESKKDIICGNVPDEIFLNKNNDDINTGTYIIPPIVAATAAEGTDSCLLYEIMSSDINVASTAIDKSSI